MAAGIVEKIIKIAILIWLICLVFVVVFTGRESAYRPKTVIRPDNPEREALERQIDTAPLPKIKRSKPEIDTKQTLEQNRTDNQKAIDTFKQLPNAQQ